MINLNDHENKEEFEEMDVGDDIRPGILSNHQSQPLSVFET